MSYQNDPFMTPLEKSFADITFPFKEFIRDQKTSNALLVIATITAIILANSPWRDFYHFLHQTTAGIFIGDWSFEMSEHYWINDGLMTLFFYVIGLEIKRELLAGELQSFRFTVPIIAAALGGMIFPAAIYFSLNVNTITESGWGIPMATDTAFAVGVLALLGNRIPLAVTAFLTALAIFDDLGAILVIALFYADNIKTEYIQLAVVIYIGMMGLNKIGVRQPLPYLLGGILLWFAIHASGIHSTIAGILAAMTVPAKPKHDPHWFAIKTRHLVKKFEKLNKHLPNGRHILSKQEAHEVIEDIERVAETATTPLQRWERTVRRPIALFILPIFALTNAGIPVETEMLPQTISDNAFWGIVLGLLLGKSIGITSFTWLALKTGIGILPDCVNMKHVIGIGLLGGMGFTMSIFIAGVGFTELPTSLINSKTAILTASLLAGILGYLWMYFVASNNIEKDCAR